MLDPVSAFASGGFGCGEVEADDAGSGAPVDVGPDFSDAVPTEVGFFSPEPRSFWYASDA